MMAVPPARHPGPFIRRRFMEPLGLTLSDLAKAMGVSVSSVSRIVNEKSDITGDMALRLSYVLGNEAETWMKMQSKYDLAKARENFDSSRMKKLYVRKEAV